MVFGEEGLRPTSSATRAVKEQRIAQFTMNQDGNRSLSDKLLDGCEAPPNRRAITTFKSDAELIVGIAGLIGRDGALTGPNSANGRDDQTSRSVIPIVCGLPIFYCLMTSGMYTRRFNTISLSVAWLLAVLGSLGCETLEVLMSVPFAPGATRPPTVMVTTPPAFRLTVVLMFPLTLGAAQLPPVATHVHVTPPMVAGSVSVMNAPLAKSGPALVTTMV